MQFHKLKISFIKQTVIAVLSFFTLITYADDRDELARVSSEYGTGSDCIWLRTVRDYAALDDRHLLIRASGKRNYLVTLLHRSLDLRSSMGLGFSSRDDQLCPYGGDAIVVEGLSRETVGIRAISRVDDEQADELMVRFGKKGPDEQMTPAPKPVKGADVEELD